MSSVIVVAGPNEGDYYPLKQTSTVVGRDAKCPIQIVDQMMSRVHLEIRYEAGDQAYYAKDLKSANGVMVNGNRLMRETKLVNGDLLELGNSKLMYFAKEFPDRESAWHYYKIAGERTRGTIIQNAQKSR